ncbi:MAG TPA: sugar phosphate isomerase/epimerase family protein [Kofleriaceae bacterium]|jgi:sugar phosphate isomerase/epimerase|nr:sugar phosphate isomerase/epimerase family protein [Kofleriaceae bacterium]
MSTPADHARLSLNQITTNRWSLAEALQGCLRAGLPAIGIWRHKIAEVGLAESRRLVREAGLRVSSVCRGGMFPAATAEERALRIEDNRRALDEAAELGTDTLVLVCGPPPDRDLPAARCMVEDAIAQLVPYARERKIRMAIEPLHPMYAAERSCITSLEEANALAEKFPPDAVGVVIDVYHVWWDVVLDREIARAGHRIRGFHVCDWLVPTPDMLLGRGMMGDGCIDLHRIHRQVEAAGYAGFIEVEILNQAIWDQPGDEVLERMKQRYRSCVLTDEFPRSHGFHATRPASLSPAPK